jgi:hypothetical protein
MKDMNYVRIGEEMKTEFVVLKYVSDKDKYLALINKVKSINIGNPSKDFYRIYLKGHMGNDINLANLYKDIEDFFYHVEIFNETIPDYDLDALEDFNHDNIVGQFIKSMKDKDLSNKTVKEALYIGLEVLLKEAN